MVIDLEEQPRTECCNAKFVEGTDLCSDCQEHTEPIEQEEDNKE